LDSIEDILDAATGQVTVWLSGNTLTAARIVSWNRQSGILVCRGGNGFTDEDIHHICAGKIQGLTLRVAAPLPESDRIGADIRDAIRKAAGYPVSLVVHPGAFSGTVVPLGEWLSNILGAITLLAPHREAIHKQIDQILLREGTGIAVLGGSTLILEAAPELVPSAEEIRSAIAGLL